MKKLLCITFILFVSILDAKIETNSNDILIKQGDVTLGYSDLDGFMYWRIPKDKRVGFISSLRRRESLMQDLLLHKHIFNFGLKNGLYSYEEVLKKAKITYLSKKQDKINETVNMIDSDRKYNKIINFLVIEEGVKLVKKNIKDKITANSVLELAKEFYVLNSDKYIQKANRNISYLEISYSNENKEKIEEHTSNLLNEILYKDNFKSILNKYKNTQDYRSVFNLENFEYSKKYKDFSDFVFKPSHEGVINSIFKTQGKLYIIKIDKIFKKEQKSFNDVKDSIIERLLNEKYERDFQNLITKLTKVKAELNSKNIENLVEHIKNIN